MPRYKTVAIACQGGGSHCAFGAGVLCEMLSRAERDLLTRGGQTYRVAGFSGTSGGAINALLAWYGFVNPAGPQSGIRALEGFWRDTMATTAWDALTNAAMVATVRLRDVIPSFESAPNAFSDQAQENLRSLLQQHVRFPQLRDWVRRDGPELFIGAANVVSGKFTVFGGTGPHAPVTAAQVLASAAEPDLFRAVKIDEEYFWDGLLSQNPPLRNFIRGRSKDRIPDEIWIIRINPVKREPVPTTLAQIRDRRNEMAGNLALEEEVYFIRQVNKWVREGRLPDKKVITLHEIDLEHKGHPGDGLDYASKLDRSPDFIDALMQRGRAAAQHFFQCASSEARASRGGTQT